MQFESGITEQDQKLIVGRISGLFGVKGWLKVFSHTDPRENIFSYNPWWLKSGKQYIPVQLETGRIHGKGLVAKLENLNDRDEAAALLNQDIYIDSTQLESLQANEYYWSQLIGLDVVTTQGEALGKIETWLETGANDVLVVTGDRQRLIPYVQDRIIKAVDIEQGVMQVDWHPDD